MSENKPKKPVEVVLLKSYPKVIFFWPLLITSWILYLIEAFDASSSISLLGYIWFIFFFANIFVIAFDFSSAKFFVLILIIVVVILILIFLVLPNVGEVSLGISSIDLALPSGFYGIMALILTLILFFVVLGAQFNYWKVERNEIYHKKGIFASAERIPTKSLRIRKEIPDVFEFFILRAGSITLMPGHGEVIHLTTVLNINKKQEQIDELLSNVRVEIDDQV
ncbi:MAG: hypothetical protein JW891_07410 [Candidatus Lokiarchaeota archaeon]|nr:hypothetical protein [Candidatus Lokiarchaeota archaeon]